MAANRFLPLCDFSERKVRLIVEAECSTCGPVFQAETDPQAILTLATAHSGSTGHVVILHGTSDVPESDEPNAPSAEIEECL
jgi:tellurite resistance-related uncharacterized protein